MKHVVFTREYPYGGRVHVAGDTALLADEDADHLITAGFASEPKAAEPEAVEPPPADPPPAPGPVVESDDDDPEPAKPERHAPRRAK